MKKSLGGLLVLGALCAGCEPEEPLALNFEVSEVSGGEETVVTSGCQELEDGLGFGFGRFQPTYGVEYSLAVDSVTFTVTGDAGVLAEGTYEEEFFLLEAEDEVVVPVDDELSLRLVHRGGSAGCEEEGGALLPP